MDKIGTISPAERACLNQKIWNKKYNLTHKEIINLKNRLRSLLPHCKDAKKENIKTLCKGN